MTNRTKNSSKTEKSSSSNEINTDLRKFETDSRKSEDSRRNETSADLKPTERIKNTPTSYVQRRYNRYTNLDSIVFKLINHLNSTSSDEIKSREKCIAKSNITFQYLPNIHLLHKLLLNAIIFVILLHVILCPYSKVEESFNMQATHDIIYHQTNLKLYDHNKFPGVVPRTFIGPLLISMFTLPISTFVNLINYIFNDVLASIFSKFIYQVLIRLICGFLVGSSLKKLANKLAYCENYQNNSKKSILTSCIFCILSISQFHANFYSSRLLPNTFAYCLTNYSFIALLEKNLGKFCFYGVLVCVIFRSELIILFGPGIFMLLIFECERKNCRNVLVKFLQPILTHLIISTLVILLIQQNLQNNYKFELTIFIGLGALLITVKELIDFKNHFTKSKIENKSNPNQLYTFITILVAPILYSIIGIILALFSTTLIDSYAWQKNFPFWPELQVFIYNVLQNKSKNWGTSPFSWYFLQALPKMLLTTLFFIPFGITKQKIEFKILFFTNLIYVFIYSFLPHKEIRFIIYTIPAFNIIGSLGLVEILDFLVTENTDKEPLNEKRPLPLTTQVSEQNENSTNIPKNKIIGFLGGKFNQMRINNFRFLKLSFIFICLVINLICSTYFLLASIHNYPGGEAMRFINNYLKCEKNKSYNIYIDNYVAQTGATLFLENCHCCKYIKTYENLVNKIPKITNKKSILLLENKIGVFEEFSYSHSKIAGIRQFDKIAISGNYKSIWNYIPYLVFKENVLILEALA